MLKFLSSLFLLMGSLLCNASVAADYTLQNDRWYLLTIPANSSAQTVEQLVGDDLPAATYNQEWDIYKFDSATQSFVNPALQGSLPQGEGFFIKQSTGSDVTLDLPADLPDGNAEMTDACASTAGCFSIQLPTNTASATWSMLGAPYETPIDVTQIRVSSSNDACASGCDLAEAKTAGLLPIDPLIYDATSGHYQELSTLNTLPSWQGFWLLSSALPADSGLTLHLPKPAPPIDTVGSVSADTNPCPEGYFEDLSMDNTVCRKLDRPELGFTFSSMPSTSTRSIACNKGAFDSALRSGNRIVLPSGCNLNVGRVNIPSSSIIEGAGVGSTTLSGNFRVEGKQNVIIRDVTINAGDAGIYVENSSNVLVERIHLRRADKSNLYFRCGVNGITIRYSEFSEAGDWHNIESRCNPPSKNYSIYSNISRDTKGGGGEGAHGYNLHAERGELAGNVSANNKHAGKFFDGVDVYAHHNKLYGNREWGGNFGVNASDIGIAPRDLRFYKNTGGGVSLWGGSRFYVFGNADSFDADTRGNNVCGTGSGCRDSDYQSIVGSTVPTGSYESGGSTPVYGSNGTGSPLTDDCQISVSSDISSAISQAPPGSVLCIEAGNYHGEGLIRVQDSYRTIRARGRVELLGVVIDANDVIVDGFRFTRASTANIRGAAISFEGNRIAIVNNYIDGQRVKTGIECSSRTNCHDALIRHNTIARIENYGIIITGSDHIVERNNVYGLRRSVVATSDVDALRFFGTGHRIRQNYFHDINEFQSLIGSGGDTPHVDCFQTFTTFESYNPSRNPIETTDVVIENNYCVRVSRQCAIFENNIVDEKITHGIVFRNNVCETYDSQVINIKGVDDVDIHNNHIGGNPRYHIVTVQPAGKDGTRDANNILIRNNILHRPNDRVNILNSRGQNVSMEQNLVLTRPTSINRSSDFQSDINYRYPAMESSDLNEFKRISAAENTVDQGIWVPNHGDFDLDGRPRAADGKIDIGPYEH